MRRFSALSAVALVCLAFCNIASAQGPSGPVIGSIPGSFDVTLSGSASYSIPIKIAPGTAGTEPKLQLVYNSQVPAGALGMGWSIVGLSAITRGPKDVFIDGSIDGIRLEDTDALYLDGQRLIPVGQTGTGANRLIEYRKWIDDQTRVYQIGATISTSIFRAQTKGGLTLTFDGSNGSRVLFDDGTTLAMAVSRIRDTYGNYVEFTYVLNGQGDYNVNSIRYTGLEERDSTGAVVRDRPGFASLNFVYEPAPRKLESFLAGRLYAPASSVVLPFFVTERLYTMSGSPVPCRSISRTPRSCLS
jgi:hypothetical protein